MAKIEQIIWFAKTKHKEKSKQLNNSTLISLQIEFLPFKTADSLIICQDAVCN